MDDLIGSLYPAESNHHISLEEHVGENICFIGVVNEQSLMACGAIVYKEDNCIYGELKRVYVKSKFRGLGISKMIVKALIDNAKSNEVSVIRLEMVTRQSEALSLYKKFGFSERNVFGSYQQDPLSVSIWSWNYDLSVRLRLCHICTCCHTWSWCICDCGQGPCFRFFTLFRTCVWNCRG